MWRAAARALAVSSSHCGPAVPPRTPSYYTGLDCLRDSTASLECPLPSLCDAGPPLCTLPHEGVFAEPPLPRPLAAPCATAADADGSFQAGVWTPKSGCQLECVGAAHARSVLQGRSLVLIGDSMVRQLFVRLVALLRGQTAVGQPYRFHESGLYRANASHDDLCAGHHVCHAHPGAFDERAGVRLRFVWSPLVLPGESGEELPAAKRKEVQEFDPDHYTPAELAGDIVLVGLLFHTGPKDTLAARLPALEALRRQSRHLFWVTTPGSKYAARNAAMRVWAAGQPNVTVLGFDKLAAAGKYHTAEAHHYACPLLLGVPSAQQHCAEPADPMNWNLAQLLLNGVAALPR